MDDQINSWTRTKASKETNWNSAHFQNPHRDWVYVNISAINRNVEPVRYRAKFNNHRGGTEEIAVGTDFDAVYAAGNAWMLENPPVESEGANGAQPALSAF